MTVLVNRSPKLLCHCAGLTALGLIVSLAVTAGTAHAAVLEIGSAGGVRGQEVTFDLTLRTMGQEVAGIENEITFEVLTPIIPQANGQPSCVINPAINKDAAFVFRPNGCTPDETCEGIKVLLHGGDANVDPIADGAVLYTCTVSIAADATPQATYPLICSNSFASDPSGNPVQAACQNGAIDVLPGPPLPTRTRAPTATPSPIRSPTATAGPHAVSLAVGYATGSPGEQITFAVSIGTTGALVSGIQSDIAFDPHTAIVARPNGRPDCTVNPDINKPGTGFVFQPFQCTPGTDCQAIRAIVTAVSNVDPIPDGARLYSCTVAIAADADPALGYPLVCSNAVASDPSGQRLEVECRDGAILPPTPTPAPPFREGNGCQIAATGGGAMPWMLLLPAVLLLRRRSDARPQG